MKQNRLRRALALACSLCVFMSLTACGEKADDSTYRIGFNLWGAGTPVFDLMGDETAYTIELYGARGSRASDENQAEKELQNLQNFISAGVDGIVMQCAADPVLPQAAALCKTAGIPFVLPTFVGLDEDRAVISASNEYYVGSVSADLYLDGYLMGQAAAADGHRTAVLLGGNIGDSNMELRIDGFTQAFVGEGGGAILNSARCTSPAESQEKANALLSAYPYADCVYAMAGDYTAGAIAAEDALDLVIPVYVSNADKDTVSYIRNGRVAGAAGGNDLASNLAVSLLINYLDGHPIRDKNGTAPELKTTPFVITQDNVELFNAVFFTEGSHALTEEKLKSLAWRFHEDVCYETYVELIEHGLTLEALGADHGLNSE